MLDTVILNGTLVDGTKVLPYKKNIGLKDGKIAVITHEMITGHKKTIDAEGEWICPGFIDTHSHGDLMPDLSEPYCSSRLIQGITTEVVGQCGISPWPYGGKDFEGWKAYISTLLGDIHKPWDFTTLESYFKQIKNKMKHNMLFLIGQGALRSYVAGFEDRPLTKKELLKMGDLYEVALKQGAFGLSLGLSYLPGVFSQKEELYYLGEITKAYDGIIMAHIRSHGLDMLEAIDSFVDIGRQTGAKIHISHCRSYGNRDFGITPETILNQVNKHRDSGVQLTLDQHPYTAGSTFLNQLIPPVFREGGTEGLLSVLENEALSSQCEAYIEDPDYRVSGWDNFVCCVGWHHIFPMVLEHEANKKYVGLSIKAAADKNGVSPFYVLRDILRNEKGKGSMVVKAMFLEADIAKLLKDPETFIGSDGLPSGMAHPRLYGSFPKVLGVYGRKKNALSLEEIIYKMTYGPAKLLNIDHQKGRLKEGLDADLVMFDYQTIMDIEDYMDSYKKPIGIKKVFVKGEIAYENQEVQHVNLRGSIIKNTPIK